VVTSYSRIVDRLTKGTSTASATTRIVMEASTKEAGVTGCAQVLVNSFGRTASSTMGRGQSTNATAVANMSGLTDVALKEIT
jgi:hypothetical protein